MVCFTPVWVRKSRMFVPCQKCNFCLMNKRADWVLRIESELHYAQTAFFLGFTYDGFHVPYQLRRYWSVKLEYPYELTLDKNAMQLFFKRLRKWLSDVGLKCKLRYYLVGEYGGEFERPHYHVLLFNLPVQVVPALEKIWGQGFVNVGQVEPASIHYCTKYVINASRDYGTRVKPFARMSRRPGIGHRYVESHRKFHRDPYGLKSYASVHGFKRRLPRYYKDKIFTSLEKEKLRVDALNARDLEYTKAIERLALTHADPVAYYSEQLAWKHDNITKKLTK